MGIKNKVTVKAARAVLTFKKNSPGLMFGVGITAMVGTVVLASKATLELEEILAKAEANSDRPNHKVRTAMEITTLYTPAIIVGSISVGCLTGSYVQLNKRNAALTAAYAGLDKAYREYRDRVREEFGDEKERQLAHDIPENTIVRDGTTGEAVALSKLPAGYSQYARFFDQMCQNYSPDPQNNLLFLKCQQSFANDKLYSRGHLFLNEVYDMLDIPRSSAGAIVGWVVGKDGADGYVDFGIFDASKERARAFVNGHESAILLDFNVDGVVYKLIEEKS